MTDQHLNLFYTYNRDSELIENNLTRAFIVLLSIVSGETRYRILSSLLRKAHWINRDPTGVAILNFRNAHFALQSNIDHAIPKNSIKKLLLTISTEPFEFPSGISGTETLLTGEVGNKNEFISVPDAWVFDDTLAYCLLIEAKVGTYPLNIDQLRSHAINWFGSSLESLNTQDSFCSATWIDVLEVLKDTLNNYSDNDSSEKTLLKHMMQFLGYYEYHLFDGFDFSGLNTPLDLVIGNMFSKASNPIDLGFTTLVSPPDFVLAH